MACVLVISSIAPASPAIPAGAIVTSASVSAAPAANSPTKQHQIKVLTAVLRKMKENYSKYRSITPGPQDIFDYQIGSLWKQGIDGSGTTVAVIEGWDDPGINKAVDAYDKKFGLPDPQIQTIFPSGDGKLPPKCPPGMVRLKSFGSCAGWRGELTLDVISAHLIAPYAKILISATPADSEITDDAASNVAPPEMMAALEYISSRHLANAISISDGEATYSHGQEEITAQDPGELSAAAAGIPVTVATGDCAVTQNLPVANGPCGDTLDTSTWDDSPWVTAVGGSVPDLNSSGRKVAPDRLWHPSSAGYSAVFPRPAYQDGVAYITHSPMRSLPDIIMDGQDGTSESAPLFAGVLALAAQLNHANVGPINPALYAILGPSGARDGIADVVKGNDSCSFCKPPVPGFSAARGFDVASGWGTVDASRFVPSLVAATRAEDQESFARHQALDELGQLTRSIQLSPADILAGHSAYLLDTGFLPGHPVGLYIDNHKVTTLTASTSGYVTYMIDPSKLKLAAGHHVLELKSMLITTIRTFTSG